MFKSARPTVTPPGYGDLVGSKKTARQASPLTTPSKDGRASGALAASNAPVTKGTAGDASADSSWRRPRSGEHRRDSKGTAARPQVPCFSATFHGVVSGDRIDVARSGVVTGECNVGDAEISGSFDGTLNVQGHLKITSTGRVKGKVQFATIEIQNGGRLDGHVTFITASEPPAPTPAPGSATAAAATTSETADAAAVTAPPAAHLAPLKKETVTTPATPPAAPEETARIMRPAQVEVPAAGEGEPPRRRSPAPEDSPMLGSSSEDASKHDDKPHKNEEDEDAGGLAKKCPPEWGKALSKRRGTLTSGASGEMRTVSRVPAPMA